MKSRQGKLFNALLLLIFVLIFGTQGVAYAQNLQIDDSVAKGEVISNDLFLVGDEVVMEGDVEGDLMAIGSTVRVQGSVSGSLLVIGRDLEINGTVNGTVYGVGMNLILGSEASMDRNLYFLGVNLETDPASQIGRDLVTITLGANLQGQVGRDVQAIVGVVQLLKLIGGFVGEQMSGAPLQMIAKAEEPVSMSEFAAASLLPLDVIQNILARITGQAQTGEIDTARLGEWGLDVLRNWLIVFLFGLLGIWLLPAKLNQMVGILKTRWAATFGIGLLAYIIVFNIVLLTILVAVMIAVIGYFLGAATLWGLAWAVWALGATALGLAFSLFWLFVLYGTKAIVAYVLGKLILDRFAPQAATKKVVSLLLGSVIFVLLAGIPILGWVITILATALGLGLTWLAWRSRQATTRLEVEAQ